MRQDRRSACRLRHVQERFALCNFRVQIQAALSRSDNAARLIGSRKQLNLHLLPLIAIDVVSRMRSGFRRDHEPRNLRVGRTDRRQSGVRDGGDGRVRGKAIRGPEAPCEVVDDGLLVFRRQAHRSRQAAEAGQHCFSGDVQLEEDSLRDGPDIQVPERVLGVVERHLRERSQLFQRDTVVVLPRLDDFDVVIDGRRSGRDISGEYRFEFVGPRDVEVPAGPHGIGNRSGGRELRISQSIHKPTLALPLRQHRIQQRQRVIRVFGLCRLPDAENAGDLER